jgi:peptidoglycan/LPS O-acetylase OafA/YrhL
MGAIRLFLAISVLQSHIREHFLDPSNIFVNNRLTLGMNGGSAVMFFFVVSGFLISYVLETKYDRPGGLGAFYSARAARIYPLWWALYLIVPFITGPGLVAFVEQRHWYDVVTGFFIFGSDFLLSFRTYPQYYTMPMPHGLELGWTLASEMTFYVIAPFLLRSRVLPILVLCFSVLMRFIVHARFPGYDAAWADWGYFFFPSTVMFFMLGHLTRQIYKSLPPSPVIAWIAAGAVPLLLLAQDGRYGFENPYFYAAIGLFALALPCIFEATKDNRISNFLGDLTYPLYLSHSVLIVLLESDNSPLYPIKAALLAMGTAIPGGAMLKAIVISLPLWLLALAVATAVHFAIERPAAGAFKWTLLRLRKSAGSKSAVEFAPTPADDSGLRRETT